MTLILYSAYSKPHAFAGEMLISSSYRLLQPIPTTSPILQELHNSQQTAALLLRPIRPPRTLPSLSPRQVHPRRELIHHLQEQWRLQNPAHELISRRSSCSARVGFQRRLVLRPSVLDRRLPRKRQRVRLGLPP